MMAAMSDTETSPSEAEKLAIRRAYGFDKVSTPYEARPTRPMAEELSSPGQVTSETDHRQHILKLLGGRGIPHWKRILGPGRHLVTDIESLFASDEQDINSSIVEDDPAPQRHEIMKSWVEGAKSGEPTFYLNVVDEAAGQFLPDNVEWRLVFVKRLIEKL